MLSLPGIWAGFCRGLFTGEKAPLLALAIPAASRRLRKLLCGCRSAGSLHIPVYLLLKDREAGSSGVEDHLVEFYRGKGLSQLFLRPFPQAGEQERPQIIVKIVSGRLEEQQIVLFKQFRVLFAVNDLEAVAEFRKVPAVIVDPDVKKSGVDH